MILSALSFSAMQVVIRLTHEIPTMEQVFVRNSFVLVVAFILIRRRKGSLFGLPRHQPLLFVRSLFGFLGLITLFYASSHAPQGDVTILNKLCPICVTLLAVTFMGEKLSRIQIPALCLSLVGAFIVFRPSFESNPLPLLSAFLSAVFSGVAYTTLAYSKNKVDALTIIMHFSTFSAIASIPFMIGHFVVPDLHQLALLLLIGLFGSLGQVFITYSYRLAPASEVSIYNYVGIIFSLFLGFLILDEPIKTTSVVGGLLVAIASVIVFFYNKRRTKDQASTSSTQTKNQS